jgi:hypothetical protein
MDGANVAVYMEMIRVITFLGAQEMFEVESLHIEEQN